MVILRSYLILIETFQRRALISAAINEYLLPVMWIRIDCMRIRILMNADSGK